MVVLAILTFYGSLVVGFGGGLVFFFRVGRFGKVQILTWWRSTPPPRRLSAEDYKKIGDVVGIPTSLSDFLLSLTPIGWMKTFGSGLSLLSRSPDLAFAAAIIGLGGLFGRLWYMAALLLLSLNVVVRQEGIEYWPQWMTAIRVTPLTGILYVIAGYLAAYISGRLIGSPRRRFDTARASYDRVVSQKGYWFDNRGEAAHYQDSVVVLRHALRTFDRVLSDLGGEPAPLDEPHRELARQQAMVTQYQRSLLLATIGRYGQALQALAAAQTLKRSLAGSDLWDRDEEQVTESQMLFLEGELILTQGDRDRARTLFQRSRSIDMELGDDAGVELNDRRLATI